MKQIHMTSGAIVALLLASFVAGASEQYPAANFQPKVIYRDSSVDVVAHPVKPAAKADKVEFDPKYPAANFQPKVIYSDASYQQGH